MQILKLNNAELIALMNAIQNYIPEIEMGGIEEAALLSFLNKVNGKITGITDQEVEVQVIDNICYIKEGE